MDSLLALLSERSFMPHGHCYLWTPAMVWLQVITNGLIGISYVAISLTLASFLRRAGAVPLRFMYACFGVFIIACGFTHFMDVLVIWQPRYWLDVSLRAVTALASVSTAILLPRVVPKALLLLQGARTVRAQGVALEAAVSDLATMYRRTRELDELKTSFFSNVSHELRTPLTLILAPVEALAARSDLPATARRDLDVVRRNAQELLRCVNDLLDISKLEAGRLVPSYQTTDLSKLIQATAAQFEALVRERKLELRVDTPAHLPAEVDVEKLRRVAQNLIANAIKFTPEGGIVVVTLTQETEGAVTNAVLSVADSGPGIPVAEREQIFERFVQGNARASGGGGSTGLGLSIVREFTALHGGRVQVGDAAEGGARFEVSVPVAAPSATQVLPPGEPSEPTPLPAPLARPEAPAQGGTEASERGLPCVLWVEDNPDMRDLVSGILRERYRVVEAVDGAQALTLLGTLKPDLIISDLMMPKMTGEQLLRGLRALPQLDAVPVLLLTAKADDRLRAHLLESGAQDYLLKPFARAELLARAGNLVAAKRARELLCAELNAREGDLALLSRELIAKAHALEASLRDAREARAEADKASSAKTDFLSLVSHELRTPLTAMALQMDGLRRGRLGTLSDPQLDALHKLERFQARLRQMLDALIDFASIERGGLAIDAAPMDLVAIAREVVEELRPRAELKGLSLVLEAADPSVYVQSDARLVTLMLTNLLDNAIRYTEHGAVRVSIERGAIGPCVRVVDSGPGLNAAQQTRIFAPFEQLEDVRHKRSSGVGLGLSVVKSVAEAVGATVEVESSLGRGSAFTLAFNG